MTSKLIPVGCMPLFGGDTTAALAEHLHSTPLFIRPFNSPADVD
jgi:hypothetical protein